MDDWDGLLEDVPDDNARARSKPKPAAKKTVEDEWDDLGFGAPEPTIKRAGTAGP